MTRRLDFSTIAAGGMKMLAAVRGYIAQSGLPKSLTDLVYLQVSQINGCAYCIDMHSHDLLKEGTSVEKLVLVPVWREAGELFSEQETAALRGSETLTMLAQTGAPDAEFQAAAACFSEKELADLTIAIGLMNAYNRIGVGFRATPAALKN